MLYQLAKEQDTVLMKNTVKFISNTSNQSLINMIKLTLYEVFRILSHFKNILFKKKRERIAMVNLERIDYRIVKTLAYVQILTKGKKPHFKTFK